MDDYYTVYLRGSENLRAIEEMEKRCKKAGGKVKIKQSEVCGKPYFTLYAKNDDVSKRSSRHPSWN